MKNEIKEILDNYYEYLINELPNSKTVKRKTNLNTIKPIDFDSYVRKNHVSKDASFIIENIDGVYQSFLVWDEEVVLTGIERFKIMSNQFNKSCLNVIICGLKVRGYTIEEKDFKYIDMDLERNNKSFLDLYLYKEFEILKNIFINKISKS